jgi:superfamily II DNA/RNA helicase
VPVEDHIALPQPPDVLFSLAVGLLGDAAAAIADMSPEAERDSVSPEALAFSATYFDAYLQSRLDTSVQVECPILASACFFLANNPGSSKVLANQAEAPPAHYGSGLALLAYRLLRGDYSELPESPYRRLSNQVLAALWTYLTGQAPSDDAIGAAAAIREESYRSGDGRELLYADIAAAVLRKKIAAAATTILPGASGIPLETWRIFLSRPTFPRELWPSQQRICAAGVLRGTSAVIQMPTSAGKTRATELILRSGFLADRFSLAVIVCPFRSLCHDIRSDMTASFANDSVVINEATDSFQEDLEIEQLWAQKTIMIVTPEKLLYLLRRNPELANNIGLVVYDEGHQFDSGARGVTYELLLTSLKLLVAPNTQIVLISAVIANAARIADWLLGNSELVVDGAGLLPMFRSIAFTSWRTPLGRLEYVSPLDPDDLEFFVPRVIEEVRLATSPREKPRTFPKVDDGRTVGLYLGLKLVPNGTVALFCGRKDTAAGICEDAVDLFHRTDDFDRPSGVSNADEVSRIANLFALELGEIAPATRSTILGIFPHHASVPHGLKLSIEFAMKSGLIRFVVCTSTLAQGVNLPIKYLIVTGVYQGKERMLVRDFHNLIGRAGRAGMHAEGSVIFADNAIFDNKGFRKERWRWESAKELLDPSNSEPSASSILEMFEPFVYGRRPDQTVEIDVDQLLQLLFSDSDDELAASAETAHQLNQNVKQREFVTFLQDRAKVIHGIAAFLLAHLNFNEEGVGDRAVLLATNTLAHFLADNARQVQIELVFRRVADGLLDATTEDLRAAIRRSPLAPRLSRTFGPRIMPSRWMFLRYCKGSLKTACLPKHQLRCTNSALLIAKLQSDWAMRFLTQRATAQLKP